jgi:hypothetical protein
MNPLGVKDAVNRKPFEHPDLLSRGNCGGPALLAGDHIPQLPDQTSERAVVRGGDSDGISADVGADLFQARVVRDGLCLKLSAWDGFSGSGSSFTVLMPGTSGLGRFALIGPIKEGTRASDWRFSSRQTMASSKVGSVP